MKRVRMRPPSTDELIRMHDDADNIMRAMEKRGWSSRQGLLVCAVVVGGQLRAYDEVSIVALLEFVKRMATLDPDEVRSIARNLGIKLEDDDKPS
jgi:hypothetical protein